jgi:hypothetical protein
VEICFANDPAVGLGYAAALDYCLDIGYDSLIELRTMEMFENYDKLKKDNGISHGPIGTWLGAHHIASLSALETGYYWESDNSPVNITALPRTPMLAWSAQSEYRILFIQCCYVKPFPPSHILATAPSLPPAPGGSAIDDYLHDHQTTMLLQVACQRNYEVEE